MCTPLSVCYVVYDALYVNRTAPDLFRLIKLARPDRAWSLPSIPACNNATERRCAAAGQIRSGQQARCPPNTNVREFRAANLACYSRACSGAARHMQYSNDCEPDKKKCVKPPTIFRCASLEISITCPPHIGRTGRRCVITAEWRIAGLAEGPTPHGLNTPLTSG